MARTSRDPRAGDERNMGFDVGDAELEDLKPGVDLSEKKAERATEGDHDRLSRSDTKRIPQEPLADRIRKVRKGA